MFDRLPYPLLVLCFCLSWSSAFPAAKFALSSCPPELFLGIRFLAAAVLLLGFAAARGQMRGLPWGRLALLGLLNQAGYNGLAWVGMQSVSAGLAVIVSSLNPILVAVLAAPLLNDRLTPRKLAGLALGLAGAAFIVRDRIALGESGTRVLLLVGSLISMVTGTLLFKKWAPAAPLPAVVGVQQGAAGVTLLLIGLFAGSATRLHADATFWLSMAWFVLVVSVGAFLLWFALLRRGSAAEASALHFLMPPLGMLMSWAALGETLRLSDLLGVAPVAAGIWLVTRAHAHLPRTQAVPAR
jgi:drug/metabolite transporter (DMT)-like permease